MNCFLTVLKYIGIIGCGLAGVMAGSALLGLFCIWLCGLFGFENNPIAVTSALVACMAIGGGCLFGVLECRG
jgi:hypothetical protein